MVDAVQVDPDKVSSRPLAVVSEGPQPPTARHDVAEKHSILSTSMFVEPRGSVLVALVQLPLDKVSNSAWVWFPLSV